MEKIKLFSSLIAFGNADISNLIVRTLKVEDKNIIIDKKRLKNELSLYKYTEKNFAPSIISALIVSILCGKDMVDSYNKAAELMSFIRKEISIKNKIGVNLLCYFIYNTEDFTDKFSEFNMLSGIKEEEISFQKEKISIIMNNEDILEKIIILLEENDFEFNVSLLKNIPSANTREGKENAMQKYFESVLEYKTSGPKELIGNFSYLELIRSNIGETKEDFLIGKYSVVEKTNDYIIINSKRGKLKILINHKTKEKNNLKSNNSGFIENYNISKLQGKWKSIFDEELKKEYFVKLLSKVNDEYLNEIIYPPQSDVFRAFLKVAFEDVKVVIIGQDPYHQKNQANGLCFSVYKDVKNPPSLNNIFKELENEYGVLRTDGDLSDWASQGVLMLNSVLTVKDSSPASHSKWGWEIFTDRIVDELGKSEKPIVFILWGNYAINKAKNINNNNHLILKSNHPSPLSCHRGFLGNNHFKEANAFLEKNNLSPINWTIRKE